MANRTNSSTPYYSYEYYLDYLDLLPVDEKKLKANKHSIVIAFWVSLAAFVVLLFLILLLMSWSGPPHGRNSPQPRHLCRWSHSLPLPSCLGPAHQDRVKEPGGRAGAKQRLPCDGPPALPPMAATAHPALIHGGPRSIS